MAARTPAQKRQWDALVSMTATMRALPKDERMDTAAKFFDALAKTAAFTQEPGQ